MALNFCRFQRGHPANKIDEVDAYASDLKMSVSWDRVITADYPDYRSFNITQNYDLNNPFSPNNPLIPSMGTWGLFNSVISSLSLPGGVVQYTYGSTFDPVLNQADVQPQPTNSALSWGGRATQNSQQDIQTYKSNTNLNVMGIVRGRIDNGYLQGFSGGKGNPIGTANLIAFGNTTTGYTTPQFFKYESNTTQTYQVMGLCNDAKITGAVIDLQPFNLNDTTQQSFYNQLLSNFTWGAACGSGKNGKAVGIVAYPGQVGPNAKTFLSNYPINAYVIYPLYDVDRLGLNPAEPMMKVGDSLNGNVLFPYGTYLTCANAQNNPWDDNGHCSYNKFNDTTQVPYAASTTYYQRIQKELTAISNIHYPFKLLIPAAASTHEFQSAYAVQTQTCNSGAVPSTVVSVDPNQPCSLPGSGAMGGLLGTNTDPQAQLDYVQAALAAINASNIRNNPYFMGIDISKLSDVNEWSPNPALVNTQTGMVTGSSAAMFLPASPPPEVINYLQNNLVDQTGHGTVGSISNVTVVPGKTTSNSYTLQWTLNCAGILPASFAVMSQLYKAVPGPAASNELALIKGATCGTQNTTTFTNPGNYRPATYYAGISAIDQVLQNRTNVGYTSSTFNIQSASISPTQSSMMRSTRTTQKQPDSSLVLVPTLSK